MKNEIDTCKPIGDCKKYCKVKNRPCETGVGTSKVAVMSALFDIEVVDVPNGVAAGHGIMEYLLDEGVIVRGVDYTILSLQDLSKIQEEIRIAIDEMDK